MNWTRCGTALLLWAAFASGHAEGGDVPERSAYFGDLHIHTNFSFDAFLMGNRTSPADAYRYARGEPIAHPSGVTLRLDGPPLDFLMVADHGQFLGVFVSQLDANSPIVDHPEYGAIMPGPKATISTVAMRLRQLILERHEFTQPPLARYAWSQIVRAAEEANDPGAFTAFIGYEYTPGRGGRHLHRNVVFRGSEVPDRPFTAIDSGDPEDLWVWMDELRANGIESMAIPHNMNQTDGLAFQTTTFSGEPVDVGFAELRARNEPIAEISQQKGTSETHPTLSPNDEWADFQIVQYYLNRDENKDPISVFKGGYYRDALRTGLELQQDLGVNPMELGAIGSSDSHVTAGPYDEDNFFTSRASTPYSRGSAYPADQDSWEGFWTPRQATHGTGGLAGVWAEENTRASLYDAMARKETFATSGPRIQVRMFGGMDVPEGVLDAPDRAAVAYTHAVPMGSTMRGGDDDAALTLLVWASRDPRSAWLQRIQIVKGWYDDGQSHEQVYDVACSDGNVPDPVTHRCPDNGARVNLEDCSISRDVGAVELAARWRDPDFDPAQPAFYYARVLENPTCRWSTWDALRLGIEPNPDLHATQQERAWGSPIWYRPEE